MTWERGHLPATTPRLGSAQRKQAQLPLELRLESQCLMSKNRMIHVVCLDDRRSLCEFALEIFHGKHVLGLTGQELASAIQWHLKFGKMMNWYPSDPFNMLAV
jgi:hypothetical protein